MGRNRGAKSIKNIETGPSEPVQRIAGCSVAAVLAALDGQPASRRRCELEGGGGK